MDEVSETGKIYLVDDDPELLVALGRLLRSAGHVTEGYVSAQAFLDKHDPEEPGCAILDLEMPGMDGVELYHALRKESSSRQVIYLTGHGSIVVCADAMKEGAVDFLTKPVCAEKLFAAVNEALKRDKILRWNGQHEREMQERLESLTPRENQVLELVVSGQLNKQIAAELNISEKTTKVHRGRMMEKLKVRTIADLVREVTDYRNKLGLPPVARSENDSIGT